MKFRLIGSAAAVALVLCVSSVMACPNEDAKGVKTAKGHAPCASKSATPCDPAKCGHGCDPKNCQKHAKVAADRANDGRSEGAPVAKKSGGCGSKKQTEKSVATVKDSKSKGKGCCGKKKTATVAKSKSDSAKPCHTKAKTVSASGSSEKEAILAALPSMTYRVDGETVGCSKTAAAMAKKNGKSVEYVVGDTAFYDKGEAVAKLTSLLDEQAESMRSLQFVAGGKCHRCPMTAKSVAKSANTDVKYRVGGVDFDKKIDAEKALDAIVAAVAKVSMSYKVDGKTFGCDKMAGEKCKKTGKSMSYVVGDQETDCRTTAQLMLAEARVRMIVEVALAALNEASTS